MKLAIKGHLTRGKEVIKILEMLGGINLTKLEGTYTNTYYTIDNDWTISGTINTYLGNNHVHYTIEEFLEKFPYKIGDKVQFKELGPVYEIEQMKWEYDQVIYIICDLYWKNIKCTATTKNLQPYKEDIMEIRSNIIKDKSAFIDIANNEYNEIDTIELLCGNKFEMEILNGNQIVLKRKQPVYPKTYEECCEVLGYEPDEDKINCYQGQLIELFVKLLICRDAYLRMAGKQMGLGEPWKPDSKNKVYYIFYCVSNNSIKLAAGNLYSNTVFAFPTAEMRDAFFNNFKDLIEECKELL